MLQDQSATIAVERATGQFCASWPLQVFIDGRPAGRLRRGRRCEFPVPAGEHLIAVSLASHPAGPLSVCLGPGDRVELICGSNQPPMHPWHVHAFWFFCLFAALEAMGSVVPPIRAFVRQHLVGEAFIALGFGLIGLTLYVRRVHTSNSWRPALWLEIISRAGVQDPDSSPKSNEAMQRTRCAGR
jgi:hypothetical protein